jgi:hypothetical protein
MVFAEGVELFLELLLLLHEYIVEGTAMVPETANKSKKNMLLARHVCIQSFTKRLILAEPKLGFGLVQNVRK